MKTTGIVCHRCKIGRAKKLRSVCCAALRIVSGFVGKQHAEFQSGIIRGLFFQAFYRGRLKPLQKGLYAGFSAKVQVFQTAWF